MAGLQIVAPAKINLYLHVLGRRADGYHVLDSLIAFAAAHDVVAVRSGDGIALSTGGRFAATLDDGEENLVLRAARALARRAGGNPGADITLTKNLPVAAGIGGGSSDAAAALRALDALWRLGSSDHDLAAVGMTLGADVPVCLLAGTAFAGGIGEALEPGPALPPAGVVLVNPGIELSTAAVFGARAGKYSRPARIDAAPAEARELAAILRARRNDLTAAACGLAPVIGDVLGALDARQGCLLSRMSGTGATCFGLFADEAAAGAAAAGLAATHRGWWVQNTRFLDRAPALAPTD